jgi:cytochrome c-type biogenesis protein CcmE
MLTKKVKNRMFFLGLFLTILIIAVFLILKTLNNNLLYFKTPTDVKENKELSVKRVMRLGGMVKKNSIQTSEKEIKFVVTDFKNEIFVTYSGSVPNLFLEGKGVIVEGKLNDKRYFIASRILAKHDENYMPPELKKALDKNVK